MNCCLCRDDFGSLRRLCVHLYRRPFRPKSSSVGTKGSLSILHRARGSAPWQLKKERPSSASSLWSWLRTLPFFEIPCPSFVLLILLGEMSSILYVVLLAVFEDCERWIVSHRGYRITERSLRTLRTSLQLRVLPNVILTVPAFQ